MIAGNRCPCGVLVQAASVTGRPFLPEKPSLQKSGWTKSLLVNGKLGLTVSTRKEVHQCALMYTQARFTLAKVIRCKEQCYLGAGAAGVLSERYCLSPRRLVLTAPEKEPLISSNIQERLTEVKRF